MKKFTVRLLVTLGFAVLAAVVSSSLSKSTKAVQTAPVIVTNTAAQAIPTSAQGATTVARTVSAAQSGAWNAGITGMQTVNLNGTPLPRAVGTLAVMGGAKTASADPRENSIVGSWLDTGTFTINGVPVTALAFTSNCAGGVWLTYGNSPPTAAGPSFGAWTKTGGKTYSQHSVGFTFDNSGNQNGYFDVV